MKLDEDFRVQYVKGHVKAGGVEVENGKAYVRLEATDMKIIKWRFVLHKLISFVRRRLFS